MVLLGVLFRMASLPFAVRTSKGISLLKRRMQKHRRSTRMHERLRNRETHDTTNDAYSNSLDGYDATGTQDFIWIVLPKFTADITSRDQEDGHGYKAKLDTVKIKFAPPGNFGEVFVGGSGRMD